MQLVLYIGNQQLLNMCVHPVELICLVILALIFVWIENQPPREKFPGWPRKLGRHERNVDVFAAWINRDKQDPTQSQMNALDTILSSLDTTLSSLKVKLNGKSHSEIPLPHSSQKNDQGGEDQARQRATDNYADQAASKDSPNWGFTTWGINDLVFEDSTNSKASTASKKMFGGFDSDDSVEDGVPLFPCKGNTETERGRPVQRSFSSHDDFWEGCDSAKSRVHGGGTRNGARDDEW